MVNKKQYEDWAIARFGSIEAAKEFAREQSKKSSGNTTGKGGFAHRTPKQRSKLASKAARKRWDEKKESSQTSQG